jgi:hypothetical protein
MNRKQWRAAKPRERRLNLKLSEIDTRFDIQVDGKFDQVVMIFANPKGRKIVEDLWPEVEWSTDEKFARAGCSADWLFTHVRVTRLPPHLTETVPLSDATPDSLGFAVALALHRRAWPLRVAYYIGEVEDRSLMIHTFGSPPDKRKDADLALYAEYVPPTPPRGAISGAIN